MGSNKLVAEWSRGRIAFLEAENTRLKKTIKNIRAAFKTNAAIGAMAFQRNDNVRLKRPGKRSKRVGVIQSRLTINSKSAYVVWPDGWAGWVFLDELRKEE